MIRYVMRCLPNLAGLLLTFFAENYRIEAQDSGKRGGDGCGLLQTILPGSFGGLTSLRLAGLLSDIDALCRHSHISHLAFDFCHLPQIIDYHPKDVMLTAMWLACKVEHYPKRWVEQAADLTSLMLLLLPGCECTHSTVAGSRYLNTERVTIDDSAREFKFDSTAFAEFGKVRPRHHPSSASPPTCPQLALGQSCGARNVAHACKHSRLCGYLCACVRPCVCKHLYVSAYTSTS